MEYRKPSWYTKSLTKEEKLKITGNQLAEWENETTECDKHNRKLFDDKWNKIEAALQEFLKALEPIDGVKGVEGAVRKNFYKVQPPSYGYGFSNLKGSIIELQTETKKLEAETQAKLDAEKLLADAIVFLQNRGLLLQKDFELSDAVGTANKIRFDELVAEAIEKAERTGEGFEFQDCTCEDEDCTWDGVSRRCDCNNRRVAWSYDGDFRNMTIYAYAH